MILKARGPGKFCSSRTTGVKVGKIDKIFRKVPSGERYLNFLGPAGGSRTRKGAFAFQENTIWLVETEITFSVEQCGREEKKRTGFFCNFNQTAERFQ